MYSAGVVGIYKTSTISLVARNTDFTYGTAFPLIWLTAEVSATVIAASIPFFRPLVRAVAGSTQKESYNLSKVSRPGTNPLVRTHDQLEGDDRSDKAIWKPNQHILKQTSITVQHNHYDQEDVDEGGPMGTERPGHRGYN